MKPTVKDAQLTIRMNSEVVAEMRAEASTLNISLADFVLKLYQDRHANTDLADRVKTLERAVFQQSQVA